MAINLMQEYSTLLDKRFTQKSLTEAHCGHDYSWDGVNSIVVYSLDNMAVQDYTLTGANRFSGGSLPGNIGDQTTTYTLQRKRSFSGIIEGVQNMDQKNIKKANALLKQTWDEVMVPEIDKYRLNTWASGAGLVVPAGSALTKSNIVEAILTGQSALNNKFVNRDGRVCFITETNAIKCKLAAELSYNQPYTSKAIVNGEVTRMGGLPIVAVPDEWFPSGVQFMIKYKRSTADPTKLKMLRALDKVQGIYGTVLEGLTRYDSFVLGNKADGIYVYATSGASADPSIAVSSGTATITAAASHTAYYTLDGSNPKTSNSRAVYDSSDKPASLTAGTVIKFYQEKTTPDGTLPSGIITHVVTDSED